MSENALPFQFPGHVPIEFYRDADGRSIIVTGSRRVAALKALAARGTPGFAADMPILGVDVAKPTDNFTPPSET